MADTPTHAEQQAEAQYSSIVAMVERTLAWLGRSRRLAKHFEGLLATARAYLQLAMIQLMIRRLARP